MTKSDVKIFARIGKTPIFPLTISDWHHLFWAYERFSLTLSMKDSSKFTRIVQKLDTEVAAIHLELGLNLQKVVKFVGRSQKKRR